MYLNIISEITSSYFATSGLLLHNNRQLVPCSRVYTGDSKAGKKSSSDDVFPSPEDTRAPVFQVQVLCVTCYVSQTQLHTEWWT